MSPDVTGDTGTVLRSLLDLYGAGQPGDGDTAAATQQHTADLRAHTGAGVKAYAGTLDMQTAVAQAQAGRDDAVHSTVAATGDGSLNGRSRLTNQIADFRSRARAIASVGDVRFSGPALLDVAQQALGSATKQVTSDVAAVQQQAAQIVPPPAPQNLPPRRRTSGRRRRRTRPRSISRPRLPRQRTPVPSDGTAGGRAVSAASGWLGTPYIWGGGGAGGPTGGGFDCSGLTQYAVAQASNGQVILPRTTYEQIYSGVRISPHDVRAGDLVFPADSFTARGPGHVQLAAGDGMVIEAPHSGSTVKWSPMPANAVVVRVL
ncbi:C40 family peptidase [Nocardia sp. NPDC006044]|uniref:C40 family peptidase n=1 Tax=Nocardia sp. NPDC006044 TaxID=3364306 RepID=UPI0036C85419